MGDLVADLAPVTTMADQLRGALVTDLLGAASYEVKQEALRVAAGVSGGDRRLSRFGTRRSRGRTRMGVGYDLAGRQSTIKMRPAALWALTNAGARPHVIGAGRRTRSGRYTRTRRGQTTVLALPAAKRSTQRSRPSNVRSGPVRHPGTSGRQALARLYRQVPTIVQDAFTDGLQQYADTGRTR